MKDLFLRYTKRKRNRNDIASTGSLPRCSRWQEMSWYEAKSHFLLESEIFREEWKQRKISSIHCFTPKTVSKARSERIWRQEPGACLGLWCERRNPRLCVNLDFFTRLQAESWMESRAAVILTGTIWDPIACMSRSLDTRQPCWAIKHKYQWKKNYLRKHTRKLFMMSEN